VGESGLTTDDAGASEWRAGRDEAREALREALMWDLPAARWEHVSDAVEGMAAAIVARSLAGLRQTTARLELCSPVRVATRLGDTPRLPAPQAARERITEMIDTLTRDQDLKAGDQSGLEPKARS
jgi:hypothetical protein